MVTKRDQSSTAHPPDDTEVDDLSIEYPSEDGNPLAETELQYVPLTETVSALRNHFRDRTDVYVIGDMLVYYRMNDKTVRVAPDVFVVFGATGNRPRDSWLVWREGKAPDFVMEIASQGTWRRDVAEKRDIYAGMGVTEYWRFDPTGECFTPALVGERLVDGVYQAITVPEDDAGMLRGHSAILGLDFCVLSDLELRLYDPTRGEWLLNHRETEAARQMEAEARRAESDARQAAEAALAQAQARIRELERQLQQRPG